MCVTPPAPVRRRLLTALLPKARLRLEFRGWSVHLVVIDRLVTMY
jgi:hypothetical protein